MAFFTQVEQPYFNDLLTLFPRGGQHMPPSSPKGYRVLSIFVLIMATFVPLYNLESSPKSKEDYCHEKVNLCDIEIVFQLFLLRKYSDISQMFSIDFFRQTENKFYKNYNK